jgi:protein-tyrosine phosphatase
MDTIYNIYNKGKASIYVTTDKIYENYEFYLKNHEEEEKKNPNRINGINTYISNIITFTLPPTKIDDNIYLGTSLNAANYKELKQYNINCIINVTKSISNYYENDENDENEFHYYRISVEDIKDESIINNLEITYKYIEKQINNNNIILIHCFAGRSRSVALVLFYLIKKYKKSIDESYNNILKKREVVNINKSFYDEIEEYFSQ